MSQMSFRKRKEMKKTEKLNYHLCRIVFQLYLKNKS